METLIPPSPTSNVPSPAPQKWYRRTPVVIGLLAFIFIFVVLPALSGFLSILVMIPGLGLLFIIPALWVNWLVGIYTGIYFSLAPPVPDKVYTATCESITTEARIINHTVREQRYHSPLQVSTDRSFASITIRTPDGKMAQFGTQTSSTTEHVFVSRYSDYTTDMELPMPAEEAVITLPSDARLPLPVAIKATQGDPEARRWVAVEGYRPFYGGSILFLAIKPGFLSKEEFSVLKDCSEFHDLMLTVLEEDKTIATPLYHTVLYIYREAERDS